MKSVRDMTSNEFSEYVALINLRQSEYDKGLLSIDEYRKSIGGYLGFNEHYCNIGAHLVHEDDLHTTGDYTICKKCWKDIEGEKQVNGTY